MQNCTEANRNKPFPGNIDPDSLIVQDDYVFVQVRTSYFLFIGPRLFLCLVLALSACLNILKRKKERNWRGGRGGREGKRQKRAREERRVEEEEAHRLCFSYTL